MSRVVRGAPFKTREEAKRAFLLRKCKNRYLTYEEYEKYFSDPAISFVEIGRMTGIPKYAITKLYQSYFAPFLKSNWTNGNERYTLRVRLRNAQPMSNAKIEEFAKLAQVRCPNIQVRLLSRQELSTLPAYTKSILFEIEGKRCALMNVSARAPSSHQYSRVFRTSISVSMLNSVEFAVLVGTLYNPEPLVEIFIIPAQSVLNDPVHFLIGYKPSSLRFIYIAYDLHKNDPDYHMWQYRDAWHLLNPAIVPEHSTQ